MLKARLAPAAALEMANRQLSRDYWQRAKNECDTGKIEDIRLEFCEKSCEKCGIQALISSFSKHEIQNHDRVQRPRVVDPLSIDILEGKVREGQTVSVNAKDGALEF